MYKPLTKHDGVRIVLMPLLVVAYIIGSIAGTIWRGLCIGFEYIDTL